jgi:hypothetical protein
MRHVSAVQRDVLKPSVHVRTFGRMTKCSCDLSSRLVEFFFNGVKWGTSHRRGGNWQVGDVGQGPFARSEIHWFLQRHQRGDDLHRTSLNNQKRWNARFQ